MKKIEALKSLYKMFSPCELCPLDCRVNRLKEEVGVCNSGLLVKISNAVLYKGEEPPLTYKNGSGAIFFSNCSLKCVYCQNYQFSQLGAGRIISVRGLASTMLDLESKGAANINFITATHYAPQAMASLQIARERGLKIPAVWNTVGYEKKEVIELLNEFIDIYLPDLRYVNNEDGVKFSFVENYFDITLEALKTMVKSKPIKFDALGRLKQGVIVRYLVFPNKLNDLRIALRILKENFGDEIFISVMTQYVPVYRAKNYEELSRSLTKEEITEVKKIVKVAKIRHGWVQYG
ncbi:MAG: radical SAM protein [Caldisericaceae bacterium]